MQISCDNFYTGCSKKFAYKKAVGIDKQRPLLLKNAMKAIAESLAKKNGRQDEIISNLAYPASDFEFAFLKTDSEEKDKAYLSRFCSWFQQNYETATVRLCPSFSLKLEQTVLFGDIELEGLYAHPTFIIEDNTGVEIMYLYYKQQNYSRNGKTLHTKCVNFLPLLAAKINFEQYYPGCKVSFVSITGVNDKKKLDDFCVFDAKSSNYHCVNYEEILFNGQPADMEELKSLLHVVLNSPVNKDCYMCEHKALCQQSSSLIENVGMTLEEKEEKKVYSLPEYTKEQSEVVNHREGSLLMLAGPGSGKTAVLTGRTVKLVQSGIPPENILLLAFTNKAVGEIQERILPFMPPGRIPKIATINSLAWEIIKNNSPRKLKVLTELDRKQLIYNLLMVTPKLKGFNYNLIVEKGGLVETVCNRMERILPFINDENVVNNFKTSFGVEDDFIAFVHRYKDICYHGGYVTFDEQISLCVKLLEGNPALVKMYNNLYRYIMVDEYQDLNEMQYRLIKFLSSHGNICVAGDDDQSIYGFRNADVTYIKRFKEEFNAKSVTLNQNFRCTSSVVDASKQVLQVLGTNRIDKKLFSLKQGIKPQYFGECNASIICNIIENALSKGYSLSDIAIIGRTNKELVSLLQVLKKKVPCHLARIILRDDALFGLMYSILCLYYDGLENNDVFLQFLTYFGIETSQLPFDVFNQKSSSLYLQLINSNSSYHPVEDIAYYEQTSNDDFFFNMLSFLSSVFSVIRTKRNAKELLEEVTVSLGINNASSYVKMEELVQSSDDSEPKTIPEFYETLHLMEKFQDDTAFEPVMANSVSLYTTHSSKGKEFPIVIMLNCEVYDFKADELRLAYVAMTRALEELYLLADTTKKNCTLLGLISDNVEYGRAV